MHDEPPPHSLELSLEFLAVGVRVPQAALTPTPNIVPGALAVGWGRVLS